MFADLQDMLSNIEANFQKGSPKWINNDFGSIKSLNDVKVGVYEKLINILPTFHVPTLDAPCNLQCSQRSLNGSIESAGGPRVEVLRDFWGPKS